MPLRKALIQLTYAFTHAWRSGSGSRPGARGGIHAGAWMPLLPY
jgi:hypothetical protein